MMRKRVMGGILAVALAVSLPGCVSQVPGDRQVVEKQGKKITVLENKNQLLYNEIALDRIDSLKGMRGKDWLDEDVILVSQENPELEPVSREGELMHPLNLYLHNLKAGTDKLLYGERSHQGHATFSPDRKKVFYKQFVEESTTGYILDMASGKRQKISGTDAINTMDGRWVDNEHVLFSTMEGVIQLSDTNGKITDLGRAAGKMINNTFRIGSKVFYNTPDGKMFVLDPSTGESVLLQDNVVWIVPSADEKQLALVKRTGETKMALYVTDLQGSDLFLVAEGTQVYGTNWSPDGSRLAYVIMSQDEGLAGLFGLFVTDVKTRKTTQLSVDIQYAGDPVHWSPSGKKLLVSTIVPRESLYEAITYVVHLK